ncbi:Alpha/Beta hydrolase protein [Fimicolochytrium jonesii]|uniref:Alpha/Beta hydrolase protein n=1 Tax=Fimicolochytrium jonesii TaxID=1396493 RepID=UPI0022FDC6C4|nr:Alpha/Beta hydrolase protein [Fimicolochytrium jonesii]KAI8824017.1 Alpha/Beta hydrolase protein [Fimicolochytrium jonesii]
MSAIPPPTPTTLTIGGLDLYIFGLPEPNSETTYTAYNVVFHAHGRGWTAEQDFPFCRGLCERINEGNPTTRTLVATFDQRNHGRRLLSGKQNTSWKENNDTHAMDMFAMQYGTACDVSFLIDVLPCYLPGRVEKWGMCGISLGGHSTFLALALDPRLTVGVPIIGCGDFLTLMTGRAAHMSPPIPLPPHSEKYINAALLKVLKDRDPINKVDEMRGKAILIYSGAADTLVPASANIALVDKLTRAYEADGKAEMFRQIVEEGAKHELTEGMKRECAAWFRRWLA